MRWATLYLRSRQFPRSLVIMLSGTVAICLLWAAFSSSPTVNARLMTLTLMLHVAAFGVTLGTVDEGLERTAAHHWPVRRALHLLLVVGVITAVLACTQLTSARLEPFAIALRNGVGLLGLTALGAAFLGPELSWAGSMIWTLICLLPFSGESTRGSAQVATWLVQNPDAGPAAACAVVLAVTGAAVYALRGCPEALT